MRNKVKIGILMYFVSSALCVSASQEQADIPGMPDDGVYFPSTVETKFYGKTIAQGVLRSQVMNLAVPYIQMASNCPTPIESITSNVQSIPKPPKFVRGTAVDGILIEKWVASVCNKSHEVFITYKFTSEGKTNFSVSSSPMRDSFLESLPNANQ